MRETEPRPGFRLQPDARSYQPSIAEPSEGRLETVREPSLFASSIEEPRRRSGAVVWLAAAVALVVGIGIGFGSGYQAGKGSTPAAAPAPENPAATSGAVGGQPFSESPVQEPVNLNPEPTVTAPEKTPAGPSPVPAGPPRGPTRPAAPAPQRQERGFKPAAAEIPPAGPASLEVVSRPSGAQVILDGRSIGKTPMTIPDVTAGGHSIRLELAGFKGWATTVDVKGGTTRVAASLEQ